jgi:ribonuclease HII
MAPRASRARGSYVDRRTGRRRKLPRVPGIRHERAHWDQGLVVAGVDEVGRGAWAGPVTCGAVVLSPTRRIYKVRDSKVLDAARREHLAARIHEHATATAVGHASNDEIDRWGMTRALRVAARRAVDGLGMGVDVILLDGNFDYLSDHPADVTTIVKGDAHSSSIAAASIVAKVARDALMVAADDEHPGYDFASNKGYPAPSHVAGLDDLGPCRLHRHSWNPIVARTTPRLW